MKVFLANPVGRGDNGRALLRRLTIYSLLPSCCPCSDKSMVCIWDCRLGFCWVLSLPSKEIRDLCPTSQGAFAPHHRTCLARLLCLCSSYLLYWFTNNCFCGPGNFRLGVRGFFHVICPSDQTFAILLMLIPSLECDFTPKFPSDWMNGVGLASK